MQNFKDFSKPQLFDMSKTEVEMDIKDPKNYKETKQAVSNFNQEEAKAACEALLDTYPELYFAVLEAKFNKNQAKITKISRFLA